MRRIGLLILISVTGLALTWLGVQSGWWWLTPIAGLLIGILLRPARLALLIALVVGALGWGLPLTILAFTEPIGPIGAAVEAVVGLPPSGGAIIIVLTVVFGGVLCLVGAWVGIAGKGLAVVRRGRFIAPSSGDTTR